MRIENDIKLDFKDVLIRPKRSTLNSRADVVLDREFNFKHSGQKWKGVPLMASNMDGVGCFEVALVFAEERMITCIVKTATIDEWIAFGKDHEDALPFVAISSGSSEQDYINTQLILAAVPGIQFLQIDIANGYSEHFVEAVKKFRASNPLRTIIAGNVVTGEMTEELILSGADVVKIGIGPGSVCTTRIKTGVGYPQLSAIIECADAAHGLGGYIVGDGGLTCSGDFAKAFGGGADFAMAGGLFAGHTEGGGEVIDRGGKPFVSFYGMSSRTAMEKNTGEMMPEYRSSEGKLVSLPFKGPIKSTILDMLGGIRSCCTYTGSSSLKELPKRTTFVRVTQQVNALFGSIDEGVRVGLNGEPASKRAKVEN
jgi:GMP reductase